MRKNVLIYPYDNEIAPVVRSAAFNSKYKLVGAVSPHGWGYAKRDVGYVDGLSPLGINVESNIEELIDLCDTVIFAKSEHEIDFDKAIYPKMITAIKRKKEVLCLINDYDLSEIKKLASENDVDFIEYDYSSFEEISENAYITSIDIPVIAVLGLSENMDKFLIQLMVTERLSQLGYKALLVGSRSYSYLLDSIAFPKFMFEHNLSETKKIQNFNRFIKSLEATHRPDIIIIGVPGGILPYNKIISNNFGITAFEVMQALTPDFCILSLYSNIYTKEYFDNLQYLYKYRYGSKVDIFNIANRKIDSGEMFYDPDKVRTYTVSDENMILQVENAKEVSGMFITNARSIDSAETIVNRVIDILSGDESGLAF